MFKRTRATIGKALARMTDYAELTVTTRERHRSVYQRHAETLALLPYIRGYVFNCANIVATAVSQQPARLYRVDRGGSRRLKTMVASGEAFPASASVVKAMRSRRLGRKAATYAGLGRDVVEVPDHASLDLLLNPNPIQTGESFDYQTVFMGLCLGEMFHVPIGDGEPDYLVPALPQFVEILPTDDRNESIIGGYAYARDRSAVREFGPDEMTHYKHAESPFEPYHGYGPLHACFQAARIVAENEDFDYEMIDRGNIPPLFISLDPNFYRGRKGVEEFMSYLDEKTRGARGKTRAIGGVGMNVVSPSQNAREMQTLERLREHKATIRQAFNVAESILELNAANLASATEGNDQFWGGTVRPVLNRLGDYYTEAILPRFGLDPGEWFIAYDDPMMDDVEAEARIAEIDLRSGVRSINEIRQDRNLEPIGPDGDVYRINGVPAADSGKLPAAGGPGGVGAGGISFLSLDRSGSDAVEVSPRAKGVEPNPDIAGRIGTKPDTPAPVTRTKAIAAPAEPVERAERPAEAIPGPITLETRSKAGDPNDGARNWPESLRGKSEGTIEDPYTESECGCRRTKAAGDEVEIPAKLIPASVARAETATLRSGVVRLRRALSPAIAMMGTQAITATLTGAPIDFASLAAAMTDEVNIALRQLFASGYRLGGAEIGPGIDSGSRPEDVRPGEDPALIASTVDPRVLEDLDLDQDAFRRLLLRNEESFEAAFSSYYRRFSSDVAESTASQIEKLIQNAIANGDSPDDLRRAIVEADDSFANWQAERIARTELQGAYNAGKRERFKKAGVERVWWVNAPGATPVHQTIAALYPEGREIDKPFIKAGSIVVGSDGSREKFGRDIYHPPARPNCRCSLQSIPEERGGTELDG